ncbi:BTB/POZ domain-containing protein 10 [Fasciola gigantica]|uniref:BTB/POZ domain-containing protein 10 n=1 Tax=Fasciola gigantica TaxID=46835 RepID=A0A504YUB7_FASGI|nr:BTB/POZ domain-containing protein 10 [Fasciola gigantica]
MDSDVAVSRKSDPLPVHHVVKFKPCLVLRPSSSSSPRSVTRFSGHPLLQSSLADTSSDLTANGCLSDPLPFSIVTSNADRSGSRSAIASGATSSTAAVLCTTKSSLKPCRLLGRTHRAGFSSPPPPPSSHLHTAISFEPRRRHSYMELLNKRNSQSRSPPPPANVVQAFNEDAMHTLLNGDEVTEEDEASRDQANSVGLVPHHSLQMKGEKQGVNTDPEHHVTSRDGTPPLAQAVVAALKHSQHHLFRSSTTATTTTTTSTASSSRFSPVYLSDENETGNANNRTGARRHRGNAAPKTDSSDTDSVSYVDDDDDDDPSIDARTTFIHADGPTIELDRESGYGASCSSSSLRIRLGSRRDKRRQKRRMQRRTSVGTSTAETHSSPCEEGDEDREALSSADNSHSGPGISMNNRNSPYTHPVQTTTGESGDLSFSARRMNTPRTSSNRHKRNRVRILDDDHQQQNQIGKSPAGVSSVGLTENLTGHSRRHIQLEGFHSGGEAQPSNGNENDDDDSESLGPSHTHSSAPSYPCSVHRYSIDTGSAPSIPTSDMEANHLESDAFEAVIESSPLLDLNTAGLAPGAAMPPPPNAVPSASILVMSTSSQSHHTTSTFSPFTSMSSGRGVWHQEMSPGLSLGHASVHHPDAQIDSFHGTAASCAPLYSTQPCLCPTHSNETQLGWWESSNCSWYGPGDTSSAFHPALLGPKSRQPPTNPTTLPLGWTQSPCSGGHLTSASCSCRPPTSLSAAFADEVGSSPPPQHQQNDKSLQESPDNANVSPATRWNDPIGVAATPRQSILSSWGMMPLRTRTSPGSSFSTTRSQRLAESGRSHSAMEQRRYSAPCPEPIYEVNLASPINPLVHTPTPARISLVVDNVRFIVDAQVLQAHPDTMLGRMISSHFSESNQLVDAVAVPGTSTQRPDPRPHPPDILVAQNSSISAHLFRAVLDYYLLGHISCPPGVPVQELKETCDYFLIPFNHHTVRCANLRAFLHELSNDGARANFAGFLETHILSLLVKCAKTGERECHVVIVTDDESIVWDPEFPPQMPENELQSHIIYSTHMFRFLKYIENREVAKQVLLERGLKKIRIGIEGYPTRKDRMKFRPGLRPEAIYNYVQCPFLRMSWEEEENKSRHVDFQCVKSKSVSDLTTGLEQAVVDPLPPPHHLTRSPLRLVSPERPDLRSASFAAQVDSLDPDGPLVLEGTMSSPIGAFDSEDPRPGELLRARTISPVLAHSPIPADREDDEEEEPQRRASPSNLEPNSPDPAP